MDWNFTRLGVYPMEQRGVFGIFAHPLVHSSFKHLFRQYDSTLFPDVVSVLFLPAYSPYIFFAIWIGCGALTFLIGKPGWHIGASGIIYGLAFFLFFSGILRKHVPLIAISLLITFLYGGLVWNMFPQFAKATTSWEGHLSGAIAGTLCAIGFMGYGPQRPDPFAGEEDEEEDEDEENNEDEDDKKEEEKDEDMREMLKEELSDAKKRVEELEHELKILLLPKDPNDDKNIMVEIRAGAGGDESALFAAEVYRMYVHYAESRHWKTEMISFSENGIGGFKEVVFMVSGQGVYSRMKYESGVHRVQRVPETESGGRIHTSTITVAVMPEAEEVDVVIDEKDIRIDVMRASGNGGQCVNTTDSAVRLTHYPTGIVIYSQTEKSQLQNKEKAFRLLRSKLYELELEKQQSAEAEARRSQIGTGDRSEKIRTYNFPQGRVTEHRIKLTLYKIDNIMNGDLDEIIDSLIAADQAAKLANMNE